MASIWPDEGLDYLLSVVPGGDASPSTLWMGFFTSQTSSTVPAASAVLSTSTGVTEAGGIAYVRQGILNLSWNAPVSAGGGRQRSTAGPIAFPTVGPGGWGTINGYFLSTGSVGGVALYYANFDDLSAIVSDINDVIAVTPTLRYAR